MFLKKPLFILIVLVLIFVPWRGGSDEPLMTPVAVVVPELQEEHALADTPATLIGTWLWLGSPYYVFEDDGYGTMSGSPIRWSTRGGVLSVCSTPRMCQNTCLAPSRWRYVINGDQLTLSSTLVPFMRFNYIRG